MEEHIKSPSNQKKFSDLRKRIKAECCSEEPNAFWHRKQRSVELPYKAEYIGKPCKNRAIPMNKEYRDHCEKRNKTIVGKEVDQRIR